MRVFDIPTGRLLHRLTDHTSHVHVLESHPTDPALAVSASYDGTLALWDLERGCMLRSMSRRAAAASLLLLALLLSLAPLLPPAACCHRVDACVCLPLIAPPPTR